MTNAMVYWYKGLPVQGINTTSSDNMSFWYQGLPMQEVPVAATPSSSAARQLALLGVG